MPKKYPKEIREQAFRLFLELENVNDIAVLMKIRRKTIAKWRKDENWDRHLRKLRKRVF